MGMPEDLRGWWVGVVRDWKKKGTVQPVFFLE